MQSSKKSPFLAAAFLLAAAPAYAARVDMTDARRAVGREDDVRIDAELLTDSVAPSSAVAVIYQIENLGQSPIAIADKVVDLSYDSDSETITFSIGAEIPSGPSMPHLVVIVPGEKRVLQAGALLNILVPHHASPWSAVPRYVQIKVNVLRDLAPFAKLLEQQKAGAAPPLPKDAFDRWLESNDAVFLNALPVRWQPGRNPASAESAGGGF